MFLHDNNNDAKATGMIIASVDFFFKRYAICCLFKGHNYPPTMCNYPKRTTYCNI